MINNKNRRGQATLETAIFVSLMLVVLFAALNYQRNLAEQNALDVQVFSEAKDEAEFHEFTGTHPDGEEFPALGATVSLTQNVDRQSNRLFQPQKRSSSSSYTVYWSNAEDPPDLNYSRFNEQDIDISEKQLEWPRDGDAYGTPEEELALSTWDYIAIAYPPLQDLLGTQCSKWFKFEDWWSKWGGYLNVAARTAAFAYFYFQYQDKLNEIEDVDERREALEEQDEQMGEWGWRVASKHKDGEDKAGKWYLKEVSAQVWDSEWTEDKNYDYSETRDETSSAIINQRSIDLGDTVAHTVWQRFDVTVPDPTIEPSLHTYIKIGEQMVAIDLGGSQSETWTTPK